MPVLPEPNGPADLVAPALLGWYLVSTVDDERCSGRIVETEAYLGPEDPASHAAVKGGMTHRNAPMFGPPGISYVYRSYGMHWCFNVVTGREVDLTNGPGRLARALGIDARLNGHPLDSPPLVLLPGMLTATESVQVTPRIGIRRGRDLPFRFLLVGTARRPPPHQPEAAH
jgi:DNA-3-methyladenine glycosylase